MPFVKESSFKSPFFFTNRHLQTIYPSVFRKVLGVSYVRERLELNDGDFVDLDYSKTGSDKIVLVLHGLEGNADRPYVRGIVKIFNQNGWDGVGMNFRGCSGEKNRLARSYHSGETEDIHSVINEISAKGVYKSIAIVGFSLGGNVTLKYLGEKGSNLNPLIKRATVFSAPIDLQSSSDELKQWHNTLYMKRFMDDLKEKVREKELLVKNLVNLDLVYASKSFLDFDEHYTAPVHGFKNAIDYWTRSSSLPLLKNITIPTLLVNAKDDSFLSEKCYPFDLAKSHKNFFLEVPDNGGHVGFVYNDKQGFYWSERRALKFIHESD